MFNVFNLEFSSKKADMKTINVHTTIPKRHIVNYVQNQLIGTVTHQIIRVPILNDFTSYALAYTIANAKHIVNQKFDKVLCRKKITKSATTLPVAIAGSVVDTNHDIIINNVDDMINHVNPSYHEIIHDLIKSTLFMLKFVSTIL